MPQIPAMRQCAKTTVSLLPLQTPGILTWQSRPLASFRKFAIYPPKTIPIIIVTVTQNNMNERYFI
ncbi:protein of unknown function [Xenorhabdus poinarii G6]|uniref:Uncharacterized protein n=1 Tax=Xenorhabdus poinarii G6 TaxID=1354304 RepID=A0A068R1I5_9GAMM|nr:protein of unknown function [Xenorhabdus poinarii G6]